MCDALIVQLKTKFQKVERKKLTIKEYDQKRERVKCQSGDLKNAGGFFLLFIPTCLQFEIDRALLQRDWTQC